MEQPGEGFIEVNEITDIMGFLKSVSFLTTTIHKTWDVNSWEIIYVQIDWRDSWLFVMVAFHIGISLLSFLSRNMVNFQVVLFISLCKFIVDVWEL